MKPPCPDCGHVHTPGDARAVGRFDPDAIALYRANYPNSPLRTSRDEAMQDMCAHRQELTP